MRGSRPALSWRFREAWEKLLSLALLVDHYCLGKRFSSFTHPFLPNVSVISQSKLSEADQLYITAIKLHEKAHGADHLDLAATLNNRGKLLLLTVRAVRTAP